MNNYDYYNYINGNYMDMNYIPNSNNMINDMNSNSGMMNDMNYYNAFPNTFMMPSANSNDTVNSDVGFVRGNMFESLYDPYKNYRPSRAEAVSKRDELLMKIRELQFAMIDLGLYLDVNPKDGNILNLFNTYQVKEKELSSEYSSKYGPLVFGEVPTNTWSWGNGPWPWEVQK